LRKFLITGALGQIGSELIIALCERYGEKNVIITDKRPKPKEDFLSGCRFLEMDITNEKQVAEIVAKFDIKIIYHLAALLSAVAEAKPQLAWDVNMNGLYNILEVAREYDCSVFTPSSIGVFGPSTPQYKTPQNTIQRPNTIYGVTKVAGELLCDYYHKRFGVDTRGLRYPGIISYKTLPGGGTTDYAVEIYYESLKNKKYTCFLKKGTYLDMMYMPDAINAAIDLMEADPAKFKHRNAYNITAMSFAPEHICAEIKKHIPEFEMTYNVDPVRQAIAESWPNSMDDSAAREEWGWEPKYDLSKMTEDMLIELKKKLKL